MDLESRSGGCHVMETGGGAEDDGFGVVGQEDVMRWIWRWWVRWMSCDGFGVVGRGHVMDLGWCVRRMSCDGLEVEAEDADWI